VPRSNRLHHYCLLPTILIAVLLSSQLLQPSSALAQAGSASVSGRVTDQTNAVMPDVEVEIKSVDTGVSQITKTNGDGFYNFPSLKPGNYLMSVRKQSFQTVSVTGITLNVQDNLSRNFVLQVGSSAVSVTVAADKLNMNTTSGSVGTVIDREFVSQLPLNGRSFNTLLQLTPGVVIAPTSGNPGQGQFSISGQRNDANSFSVDGVSANFGVGAGTNPQESGTGGAQALSVTGGTSSLVSVDALQEFRIETSSFAPEFGKTPGGQVILTTRSGSNAFHGGVFDYFRNTAMDANDWFANRAGNPRAPEHHNDFGGFLGGPIWKDKSFFFFSYEGARLGLPATAVNQVPSAFARSSAPAQLAPFLNAYPQPDDKTITPGVYTSQFTGTFSTRANLDATSVRIDHALNDRFSIFGRYNYAPSRTLQPGGGASISLSDLNMMLRQRISNTLRGNYSSQDNNSSFSLNSFGGAVALSPSLLIGALAPAQNFGSFKAVDTVPLIVGLSGNNRTRQANFTDALAITAGSHQLQAGLDYRAIFLAEHPSMNNLVYSAPNIQTFLSTGSASLNSSARHPSDLLAPSLSLRPGHLESDAKTNSDIRGKVGAESRTFSPREHNTSSLAEHE